MAEYRKQSDGSITSGDASFKALFPNISFSSLTDNVVTGLGYDIVYESSLPTCTEPYEICVRDGVEQKEGKWYKKYKVLTQDSSVVDANIAAIQRLERNSLLSQSDWTQLADKGGLSDSKVAEWVTYRQSLRDLPTATGWPHTHSYPSAPS